MDEKELETSWECTNCKSQDVFWNENVEELVCKSCGKIFSDSMPEVIANSKDRISERGTCEACGIKNAHLIAKCKKCGRKLCTESCFEDLEFDEGLCLYCRDKKVK